MPLPDPPRWADRLVEKVCPPHYLEEFQGDLHEAFHWRSAEKGRRYASKKFIFESIKVIRFYQPKVMNSLFFTLFRNYLKTGLRFLWKTRGFSSLNIIGLALGIAAAWLAYLFVSGELSYDRHHKNADRVYRIAYTMKYKGNENREAGASFIMGKVFPEQIPAIEKATWFKNDYFLMRVNKEFSYQEVHYATKDLFEMLDFEFISGSPAYFDDPDKVIISKTVAGRLEDPSTITLITDEGEKTFDVAGVFYDTPTNSTVRPEVVINMGYYINQTEEKRLTAWFDINMNVLLMLRDGASTEETGRQMTDILYANEDLGEAEIMMDLQPLTRIHLDTQLRTGNGLEATADLDTVMITGIVGLLCLLISCINFSNFALGNNLTRSREVGLRKVIGARETSILGQFLTESLLATCIAGGIALILVITILPFFTELIQNQNYTVESLLEGRFIVGGILVLLLTAIISGCYPALILSRFRIIHATKNVLKLGNRHLAGKAFISAQFGIAIFLIVGTIIANRQFQYLIDFDLGYDDENVITLRIPNSNEEVLDRFRNDLMSISGVKATSAVSGYNGTNYTEGDIELSVRHLRTDAHMLPLLGIELLEGRNFDPESEKDKYHSVIVNETFVTQAQLTDPIGKNIPFSYGDLENPTIIGVVRDYYFRSSRYAANPLVIYQSPQYVLQDLIIKATYDEGNLLPELEKAYKRHYDPMPFYYESIKAYNLRQLASENRMKKLANAGSIVAIILASLGLLSMIGTYVKQRMKEVSIRKINGATPSALYTYFSKKFVVWIAIGFLTGFFPALYFLHGWLRDYPHRITIDWTVGGLAIVITIAIFLVAVFLQLTRVVYENPVKFLRDE